ncbi:MAG: right-handed parallel beta-helix repeat-containing protein [Anaerolineales bacterium]|nr:right-handed parallel beta-helix repeat-containing protein [Anaerolineales bacterium]
MVVELLEKKRIGVILILILVFFVPMLQQKRANASAQAIEVCGPLPDNTTWNHSTGGVYTITCPVIVPAGMRLAVEPGVRVEFYSGHNYLQVYGELDVNGTVAEPVWFTASQPQAGPGTWDRIEFQPGSNGDISYAIVEYGGYSGRANIQIEGGMVSIRNSVIQHSSEQGIFARTWLTLTDNQFSNNTREALHLNSASSTQIFTIQGNTGSGNGTNKLLIVDGTVPAHLTLGENPGLSYQVGTLTVPVGKSLTVGAGAHFEMGFVDQLSGLVDVTGSLSVQGTAQEPAVFTSADDAIGQGSPGDWYRLYIHDGAQANLQHAQISYAGAATGSVYAQNASLTMQAVSVTQSAGHGIYVKESQLNITGSIIFNNAQDGLLYVSENSAFSAQPQIHNNAFVNNAGKGVYLRLMAGSGASLAISGNSGAGNGIDGIVLNAVLNDTVLSVNPSLPYVIESLTVNAQNTLQIGAGSVFKSARAISAQGTLLQVFGTLVAAGTPDAPVVFTSYYDDEYPIFIPSHALYLPFMIKTGSWGQVHTLSDLPNATALSNQPAAGDWRGIVVQTGGWVSLEHAIIRYAGYPDIGQLTVLAGTAMLDSVTVRYGLNHGVYTEDADITVRDSDISDNQRAGLRIFGKTAYIQPVIQANTFNRNGDYAVYLILNGGGIGSGEISGNRGTGNGLVNGVYVEGYITDQQSVFDPNFDFPYVIWTITVNQSARLSILPGTILKFTSPPDKPGFGRGTGSAIILGELFAVGTPTQPVVFTSYWDDSAGGDTNGDYLGINPQPGDWLGFITRPTGQANLQYTQFRYGGNDDWNIWADGGTVDLSHSNVFYSLRNGVGGTGMVTLSYNQIRYNLGNGVQINGPASVHWNYIANNGQYGLVNYYTPGGQPLYRVPATNNYWGAANGPSYDGNPCPHPVPEGEGAMINCSVDWNPYLNAPP